MIVTIDGPAGSGKSSAARSLAQRLGFQFLDTGAMYRAVTLAGLRRGIPWDDEIELARLAAEIELKLSDSRVLLDGEDVTAAIRTFEITTLTRHAADNRQVRMLLVDLQRAMAAGRDTVAEGRDQATVVFPGAECKIFLTASDEVRAERRYLDLVARGEDVTRDEVLAKQQQRDQRDRDREFGGLRLAPDSIEIDTDGMTPDEVVHRLEQIVRQRQPQ
jgi:cytidylate kinase